MRTSIESALVSRRSLRAVSSQRGYFVVIARGNTLNMKQDCLGLFRRGGRFILLALIAAACGCQSGPFAMQTADGGKGGSFFASGPFGGAAKTEDPAKKTLIAGANDFKSQTLQWERTNSDLISQLADERKRNALLTERATMMQDELNKVAIQLRDSQLARLDSEKRAQVIAASTRSRAGASISANSNARGSLRPIEIPGLEVRQDGDVIRISLPADQIFSPGTDQLLPSAGLTLSDTARAISQSYPRQLMGIEAFTDGVANSLTSPHQLTAAQALVVFNELTQRYRMSANQIMIVGHGANIPRSNAGTFAERARNRRVEIVIYPETVN